MLFPHHSHSSDSQNEKPDQTTNDSPHPYSQSANVKTLSPDLSTDELCKPYELYEPREPYTLCESYKLCEPYKSHEHGGFSEHCTYKKPCGYSTVALVAFCASIICIALVVAAIGLLIYLNRGEYHPADTLAMLAWVAILMLTPGVAIVTIILGSLGIKECQNKPPLNIYSPQQHSLQHQSHSPKHYRLKGYELAKSAITIGVLVLAGYVMLYFVGL